MVLTTTSSGNSCYEFEENTFNFKPRFYLEQFVNIYYLENSPTSGMKIFFPKTAN